MVTSRPHSVKVQPGKRGPITPVVAAAVIIAAVWGLLLAAPFGSGAPWLPRPTVETAALDQVGRLDHELLTELPSHPLSVEIRALGSDLRAYHRAQLAGDAPSTDALVRNAAQALRAHGGRPLLTLRALQTELWLRAVFSRPPDLREAEELGGPALTVGREIGWYRRGPLLTRSELGLLYRFRWTELLGLRDHLSFRATRAEWRAYYELLLRYPPGATREARLAAQLQVVRALARRDSSYPVAFAEATLLARLGQPTEALAAQLAWHASGHGELHLRSAAQLRGILEGAAP